MPAETDTQLPVTDAFVRQLAKLQTRVVDVLAGYGTMREKAEPEIILVVDRYIAAHTRHEQELASRLVSLGHKPDDDGSFFSLMQQAVVRIRSMVDGLGTNALPQVVQGEESLLEIYREAISEANDEADQSMIRRQMTELNEINRQSQTLSNI